MNASNLNQPATAGFGRPASDGYVACRIYADAEKDALMQALFNLSEADKTGAPYPADDMIYCVLETTPHTQLISQLVDELHKLGYAICPHTDPSAGTGFARWPAAHGSSPLPAPAKKISEKEIET